MLERKYSWSRIRYSANSWYSTTPGKDFLQQAKTVSVFIFHEKDPSWNSGKSNIYLNYESTTM